MEDINSLPDCIPNIVKEALEIYADYYWTMDQGYGSSVDAVIEIWEQTKQSLIDYYKEESCK